ncbi:xanthine dehydrogenase family protein subunit M [Streptomyces sp. NPDC093228]|uniref:FAD binding domain-containing protein n=1 Tax=unclassified Streptomyces TaxID=2593676 RepID=UPI0007411EBF|nr:MULTISPECIES: xanthine dehydrogenase family protein subunit M [unclassified Streptomyces]KUJ34544.1 FAD-binding molybdopterin dehydrogenase [Streptomyces sp. NRRL F-5122]REE65789.1 xanthine dehydrogenase YagS FAD-binding subunit [Streptomyces sp. 3212.3]
MRTFDYVRATDTQEAVRLLADDPAASCLAGGTTQLDLMKDGILEPPRLIDITRLPLHGIERRGESLHVGALATMEELAAEPIVAERLPVVRESLLLGASVQLRNMATIGGNLLQRTRCRYFRDPGVAECNKRSPGSGCAAVMGAARMHAVLGVSERCIALHASDLAVALVSLDALVHIQGPTQRRTVPLTEFYITAAESPEHENVLDHAELITEVEIPLPPPTARSGYLKVRDRVSYEFALTSAAVLLVIDGGTIRQARVGLGGVGSKPWRAYEAEHVLTGAPVTTATFLDAAEATMRDAWTVPGTEFKVPLARRTLVRELQTVAGVTS